MVTLLLICVYLFYWLSERLFGSVSVHTFVCWAGSTTTDTRS